MEYDCTVQNVSGKISYYPASCGVLGALFALGELEKYETVQLRMERQD
jgi:hypothetical protein